MKRNKRNLFTGLLILSALLFAVISCSLRQREKPVDAQSLTGEPKADPALIHHEKQVDAQTVKIGHQLWTAHNLNVSEFRNGDPIPEAKTDEEWKSFNARRMPAWCYYQNNPANEAKYGKLYNWYAVNDPRGLAPHGWRIPIDIEWEELGRFLGGEEYAGFRMKAGNGWSHNGNGNNDSGFNGMPGGYRHYNGAFHSMGDNGFFWSADIYDNDNAMGAYLSYSLDNLYRNYFQNGYGFSVRCIQE